MKKFLTMGALALTLAVLSTQESSAWVNSKFGVGLNWNYQSGGNNVLWGAFRNGQPPGPDGGYCPQVPGPNGGPFQGYYQPAQADQTAPAAAATTGRTSNFFPGQTVNYQYPYYYYYSNGYGR